MSSQPPVSVGLSTLLGSGAALTAFVLAIIAFIDGDRSEETIGALVTGVLLVVAVVTSRTTQQNALVKATGADDGALPGDELPEDEMFEIPVERIDPREVPKDEGDAGARV